MKLYSVNAGDGEPSIAYATKGEAMKQARVAQREVCFEGHNVEVEEMALVPITKAMIVRLVNVSGGYVDSTRIVATLPGKREEGGA